MIIAKSMTLFLWICLAHVVTGKIKLIIPATQKRILLHTRAYGQQKLWRYYWANGQLKLWRYYCTQLQGLQAESNTHNEISFKHQIKLGSRKHNTRSTKATGTSKKGNLKLCGEGDSDVLTEKTEIGCYMIVTDRRRLRRLDVESILEVACTSYCSGIRTFFSSQWVSLFLCTEPSCLWHACASVPSFQK